MKTLLLDGSPKYKDSNSRYILTGLAEKLAPYCEIKWADARQSEVESTAAEMAASDAVVLGFPLYVDSIPSHLLAFLELIENSLPKKLYDTHIYVIVNNGFYEARQNLIALKMAQIWCKSCSFIWGQGMVAGAGGMVMNAPIGEGSSMNIGKALDELAMMIRRQQTGEIISTEPNFPRFLYQLLVNIGWCLSAKKTGVNRKGLYQKHDFEG